MAFTPAYRVTVSYKNLAGQKETASESGPDAAKALALLQAKLKLLSGQKIISASQSQGLDPTGFALGHSDAAEEANLEAHSATLDKDVGFRFDEMSISYKSGLNNGTIDFSNGDIQAYVTAYNALHATDYQLISGRYE